MSAGQTTDEHGYRWMILLVGAFAQGSFAAVFFGLPALAPDLQDRYGLGVSDVGVVLTSVNLGTLLTVLPWGMLADRIGERTVMAVGMGACGVALVGSATTTSYGALVAWVTAAGLFGASVQAASGRAVMAWFPRRQRGLALAIRQTATPVGGAVAAASLPAIVAASDLPTALAVLGGLSLTAGAACLLLLRPAPGPPPVAHRDAVHPFRDRRLWRLSTGSAFLICAQSAVLGFLVVFLHETRGFSTALAAAVLAGVQLVGAALRLSAGFLSDRRGDRIRPLVRLAAGLTAALAVSTAFEGGPIVILLPSLVAAGALSLSWNSLSFTATAELAGEARAGAALGFQQTALSGATVVAPLAFGYLVDSTAWVVGFGASAAIALAGTLVVRSLADSPDLDHGDRVP